MRRLAVLLLLAGLIGAPAAQADVTADGLSADQTARIDAIGNASVAGRAAPGITIGVVRGGTVIYAKGFGFRSVEDQVAPDGATRYPIGSNTKQFTAAAILMLRDAGKLRLDAKLATYLPDVPHANAVTIRNLLQHTGGYAEYTAQTDFDRLGARPATPAQVTGSVDARPLDFTPGTKRSYSNTGYMLLQMVIERLSGMRYADFIRTKIFAPAGMSSSWVRTFDDTYPDTATEYDSFSLGPWEHAEHIDYTWFGGPGSIISNVADLAKWNAALAGGRFFSVNTYREMTTPRKIDANFPDYGYGIMSTKLPNGHRMIFHGGNTTGAATQDARFPDDGLDIIVLANSGAFSYDVAVSAIYAVLVPQPTPKPDPHAAAAIPPAVAHANKAQTKEAIAWLENAINGRVDLAKLRPDFRARMSPEHRATLRALAQRGPRTYKLINVDRRAPGTGYEFLLNTRHDALIYVYGADDSGTVAEAGVFEVPVFPAHAAATPAPVVAPAVPGAPVGPAAPSTATPAPH